MALFSECEHIFVSLRAWLWIGWLTLAADFAYWRFGVGTLDDNEEPISYRHGVLNAVLWYGGLLLFLVLLVLSWLLWRANERERTSS
jgi:hypothetical protein